MLKFPFPIPNTAVKRIKTQQLIVSSLSLKSTTEPTVLFHLLLVYLELTTGSLQTDMNCYTKSLQFQKRASDCKSVKVLALKHRSFLGYSSFYICN